MSQSKKSRIFLIVLLAISLTAPDITIAKADGESWLEGWTYRKSHTINGTTAGAQTDYQMKIIVHYGAGSDSDDDVYLDSKCRTDFGDIRFTNSSGEDLLDYFILNKTVSVNATIWVEFDSIPDNTGNATIYIYYGNAGVSTTSNGPNTFPWLFDDFNDYNVGDSPNAVDWETSGLDASNTIKVATDPADGSQKCFKIVEDGAGVVTDLKGMLKDFRKGSAFNFRIRTNTGHWFISYYEDVDPITTNQRDHDIARCLWYDGDSYEEFDPQLSNAINTWYLVENQVMYTGDAYSHWFQDGTDYTGGFYTTPSVGCDLHRFYPYRLEDHDLYVGGVGTDARYIFARKFVNPEPTHVTWGSEESVTQPSDPNLLFGAGFNTSSPYVELHWNHSLVNVQFFEVQNSSDGDSWTYLGLSNTANYTDSQVVNGTERYYKVRACNQTDSTWYNSSWTDVNFEKVYFILGVGDEGCPPTPEDFSIVFLVIGLILMLSIAFLYVKNG